LNKHAEHNRTSPSSPSQSKLTVRVQRIHELGEVLGDVSTGDIETACRVGESKAIVWWYYVRYTIARIDDITQG
jgi:hypothetical protein